MPGRQNGKQARELERRHLLHQQEGALRAALKETLHATAGIFSSKAGRLVGKLRRVERDLKQPSLF